MSEDRLAEHLDNSDTVAGLPDRWAVFAAAFAVRILGVVVTTLTTLNSYSLFDAGSFAASARHAAVGLTVGEVRVSRISDVTEVWGFMLSPFWLLPGPSRIYARLGVALLGSLAVYNVYVVARRYYSKRAGVFAVLPLVVYPSFVFVHSTVLRESAVLLGLTTVTRLLLAPSSDRPVWVRAGISGVVLAVILPLRHENLPVYGLVLGVAGLLRYRGIFKHRLTQGAAMLSGTALAIGLYPYVSQRIDEIGMIRRKRARGRTEYLGNVFPDTIPEAIAFSWIGAAYFLFTPFPWMVTTVSDFVIMFEGLCNLGFVAFAVVGTRRLARDTLSGAVTLAVGVVVGTTLYGLANANVGTAVRQRQMVLWAIFLLGGIGMAECIRFTVRGGNE